MNAALALPVVSTAAKTAALLAALRALLAGTVVAPLSAAALPIANAGVGAKTVAVRISSSSSVTQLMLWALGRIW
jgi:hypothetical protein